MTATSELDLDWLISVDDHVIEPAGVWQDRVPARYKDAGPRLEIGDGADFWVFDGNRTPTGGLGAVAGMKKEDFSPRPIPYSEMRRGCYDSVARLEDMDKAGILASLCFPSFPRFCGQLFSECSDLDLGFACIQAYNDWMIDEWCGSAPGRFIPLIIIPLRDPAKAAKEIERCAAKGAHAMAFSENCEPLGLPTINDPNGYWDPVMKVCSENDVVVCMHVGSSSQLPHISKDASALAHLSLGSARTAAAMLDWLFCDYFDKFPNLKIALSEGNIGWIPFFLQRAAQVVATQRFWAAKGESFLGHEGKPMEDVRLDFDTLDIHQRFRDHVYGCFIDDLVGMHELDEIGENNVMMEADYPHSDSTWPDCLEVARKMVDGLAPEVQYKILRGNAERLFHFSAADPPASS
jgi:predicted TIM-barrel fold metal-dependent hydrolase